jgi:hypothetical protein
MDDEEAASVRVRPMLFEHSIISKDSRNRKETMLRARLMAGCCLVAAGCALAAISADSNAGHSRGASWFGGDGKTSNALALSGYAYGQLCDGCLPPMEEQSYAAADSMQQPSMSELRAIYHSANGGNGQGLYAGPNAMRAPAFYRISRALTPSAAMMPQSESQEEGQGEPSQQMYWGGRDKLPYVQMPPARISGSDGHVMWVPNDCQDPDKPCERKWVWTDQR